MNAVETLAGLAPELAVVVASFGRPFELVRLTLTCRWLASCCGGDDKNSELWERFCHDERENDSLGAMLLFLGPDCFAVPGSACYVRAALLSRDCSRLPPNLEAPTLVPSPNPFLDDFAAEPLALRCVVLARQGNSLVTVACEPLFQDTPDFGAPSCCLVLCNITSFDQSVRSRIPREHRGSVWSPDPAPDCELLVALLATDGTVALLAHIAPEDVEYMCEEYEADHSETHAWYSAASVHSALASDWNLMVQARLTYDMEFEVDPVSGDEIHYGALSSIKIEAEPRYLTDRLDSRIHPDAESTARQEFIAAVRNAALPWR